MCEDVYSLHFGTGAHAKKTHKVRVIFLFKNGLGYRRLPYLLRSSNIS